MDYGAIIKRAWRVTWRYRALWLLGLFAGVSGCQGGGSPGGRGTGSDVARDDFSRWSGMSPDRLLNAFERYVPVLLAALVLVFGLWLLWMLLGVAARGGLIVAVDGIEEGRDPEFAAIWRAGFARFWPLVGLGLLLQLPLIAGALLLVAGVLIPFVPAIMRGGDPSAAVVAPICGTLAIGVPLLVVAGLVLDIVYLLALRYLMLGGQGVFESIRNGWRFLRVRAKDSFLMYLIGGALNAVGSIALVLPIIVLAFPLVLGGFVAAHAHAWGALAALVGVGLALLVLLAWFYTAIMGTFSSSLWTIFFRAELGIGSTGRRQDATDG